MDLITKQVVAWKFWPQAQKGADEAVKLSGESKVI